MRERYGARRAALAREAGRYLDGALRLPEIHAGLSTPAYLARGDRHLSTVLPDAEPQRSRAGRAIGRVLIDRARTGGDTPRGMLIEEIDGLEPSAHPMAPYLAEAGFVNGAMGFQATFRKI